ncbi:MAG: hypothetical protein M3Q10_09315 [Chloroflexota bacterium]|nr:hypothetical protein [Chloroflexota bacterium]
MSELLPARPYRVDTTVEKWDGDPVGPPVEIARAPSRWFEAGATPDDEALTDDLRAILREEE